MLSNYLNTYSPSPSLASGYNFSKKRGGGATALNTGYALRRCAPRPSAHWPSLRYGQRRIAWERYMKRHGKLNGREPPSVAAIFQYN